MDSLLPKISLAMIVKDEAACLKRCLDSAANLVHEMVIVDTGSTDKTVEICRSYNARVFSYPWDNDFSAARNFGLERATQDWVLWLDADEEIDQENRDQLQEVQLGDYDAFSLPLINYFGDGIDSNEAVVIGQPRLFRNHMGFRFESRIHEWLDLSAAYPQNRVGFLDIKIHHYGYTDASVENKRKYDRNVGMLLNELKENDSQAWIHYYLAAEYHRRKEYQKAFDHVNRAIRLFIDEGLIPPPSMLYSLKYSILIETASWDGAWPGIRSAVKMFPDYVDLKFFMGVILYYKQMYQEALTCFQECLAMGENNLNYLSIKGLGSFRAWHFAGLCHEKLARPEQAFLAFIQALSVSERFPAAREALAKLLSSQPDAFLDRARNQLEPEELDRFHQMINAERRC